MHSLTELKLGLTLPSIVLAVLWTAFLTRYDRDRARVSAWFALLFTSFSGIAALWAFARLEQLSKRSHMDYSFEGWAGGLALMGFVAAFVWLVRSRSLCAVSTLLVAVWLSWIYSLSY
jgi:hypothetical protein